MSIRDKNVIIQRITQAFIYMLFIIFYEESFKFQKNILLGVYLKFPTEIINFDHLRLNERPSWPLLNSQFKENEFFRRSTTAD